MYKGPGLGMDSTLRILLLEDLEEDAGLVARTLKNENIRFTHIRVDTREEFVEALSTFRPDLILSDHSLPQFNSIEALQIIQEMELNIPFILITGAVSEEFAVMCIKRGADDYVLKSNLSRLPMAIQSALEQRQQEIIRKEQQQKLKQQNEELMKVNRELDSFVYSVSHNLRAPLSSILGLVNVARIEPDKNFDQYMRYFGLIEQSIFRLDQTLKDILDYSRNTRNELEFEEINLGGFILETLEKLRYMNEFPSVHFELNIQEEHILYSDKYRLDIILSNLFSNAIKYRDSRKESSIVKVNALVGIKTVILEVDDNGIGIPLDQQPKVFNMFYRATDQSEGSGLGMYIVHEMISKLAGTIALDSIPGRGTKIVLSIPNNKPAPA